MSFLAPASLALMALLPGIVLLYFLKLKRRDEPISSTYLWRRAIQDLRVNSPFQRLRRNLLLWLQLALVALLVLSLARPAMNLRTGERRRTICLIDTSASMTARDVRPSRLAAAKDEALRLVQNMGRGDEMMLMTFDAKPAVLVPFTGSASRLRDGLRDIEAHETGTDFAQAVELIRALVQEQTNVGLVLLSDGAFDTSPLAQAPSVPLTYRQLGTRSANVGITALSARRSLDDWDQPQVFARLQNSGTDPVTARVELYLDGGLFNAQTVTVPAGDGAPVVFADPNLKEGLVRVVLVHDDDVAADNQAWLTLTQPRQLRVLAVTPGNHFLQLALEKDPYCAPVVIDPSAYEADLAARAGGASPAGGRPVDYDVVVFDRCAPPSLPQGSYLFLGALPPLDGFHQDGEADEPDVIDWDTVHPVNQYVNYNNIFIATALKMRAPVDARTLVDSTAGPLIVWWASPAHRVLVTGFDMFASRWPLRVAFPVFLANAMRYLGGVELEGGASRIAPGKAMTLDVPFDVDSVRITTPTGAAASVPARGGRVTFADTYVCGPYRVRISDDRTDTYVVNLLDPRESNTAPVGEIPWQEGVVTGNTARTTRENREIWRWLALAALAVLMVEWYVHNRRVYV